MTSLPNHLPPGASPIPLTGPQIEIWQDQVLRRGSPLYNIGGHMRIEGCVDPRLFDQAVRLLVRKHDALRTTLATLQAADGGPPVQSFPSDMDFQVPFIDLSGRDAPEEAAEGWMREAFAAPFPLDGRPLFRYALLRVGTESFRAFACYHHLIADGWSVALLARSLAGIYSVLLSGQEPDLAAPSYVDFAADDRAYVSSPAFGAQQSHWRAKLRPSPEPLLAACRADDAGDGSPSRSHTLMVSRSWYEGLGGLAKACGGTIFHALLAAFYVYFTRTAQREDLMVGLPVLNRSNAAFKATAGLFVGMTAARLAFGASLGFGELVRAIGRELKRDYRFQRFPLSALVVESGYRGAEGPRLFDIVVSYERHDYGVAFGPARGVALPIANEHQAHPLMLYVREFHDDEPVRLDFVHHRAYFSDEEAAALRRRLLRIVEAGLREPQATVRGMPLLDADELRQIERWNATRRDRPPGSGLLDLFDAQVARHGGKVAVTVGGQGITYQALAARSNRLARRLRAEFGAGPGMRVGLCMERSVEMMVGLLGILRAGAAYLPLDPSHPASSLRRTLEDARPRLVLGQRRLCDRLPPPAADMPLLFLGGAEGDGTAAYSSEPPADTAGAADLAYVIYTSGSTGRPKGVAVSRGNLLHSMRSRLAYYAQPVGCCLHIFSLAFDGSVAGTFWTLFSGGTLVLPEEREHQDASAVVALVQRHAVTHLMSIPSFYALLLQSAEPWQLASLGLVVVAAEACGAELLRQHAAVLPQAGLFNEYGPTEGSVWSTVHRCVPQPRGEPVPIGRPVENVQVHLLDLHLQPVPVGVAAEVYISGDGVAAGYLGDPALTAEKFLQCPFSDRPGERMYRTGDLARWRPDGTLEFLGRGDHQVKVRGFRIELADIEAALLALPAVRDAVVQVWDAGAGDRRLAAYVVMQAPPGARQKLGSDVDVSGIRQGLRRSLPAHMLPHHVTLLADLPRLPNGKVDRKALPPPDTRGAGAAPHVEPATPVESALAGLWARALKVERVGRHDNFFDLGGHSLLAIQLVQQMRGQGLLVDVPTLLAAPTLAELATAVRPSGDPAVGGAPASAIPEGCEAIHPDKLPLVRLTPREIERIVAQVPGGAANVQDIYPLGPQQQGMLLHRLAVDRGDAFLMRGVFAADAPEGFEPMLQSLRRAVARHDALRTAVLWEGLAEPVQVVWRRADLEVQELEFDAAEPDVAGRMMERFDIGAYRMDLHRAPLLRLAMARDVANSRWLMLLMTHHLVMDHASLDLLAHEMVEPPLASSRPPQYRDYVALVRGTGDDARHDAFFRRMLGDVDYPTLPFGLRDVRGNGAATAESRRTVDPLLAAQLRRQARGLGVGLASLCHLAWALVVARASGRDDVVFGTVLFGRSQGSGLDSAVGLFINTLPVRIRLSRQGVAGQAQEVHQLLVELLRHEHAGLALAQQCSAVRAPMPLFSALLNYRHSHASGEDFHLARAWPGVTLLQATERSNYPFMLSVDDFGEGLGLTAQAVESVAPERVCDFMHTALENLAQALADAPDTLCLDIDVMPAGERARLAAFNATQEGHADGEPVHRLFERQARRTPHGAAVADEAGRLDYRALNEAANRLAHHLIGLGVGPERLVGICLDRSSEMVVALLAILKAGGAYLPLDPAYPPDRLVYMLQDAAPALVLTRRHLAGVLPRSERQEASICHLDDIEGMLAGCPMHNPSAAVRPDHLAYVLYTSGSTGRPKGVMVRHGALTRLALSQAERLQANGCHTMLQFASLNFDMSVEEIFPALIGGLCLVIRPASMLAPDETFLRWVRHHRIDALNLPTAFWHDWVQRLDAGEGAPPDGIKLVAVGGEKVCAVHQRRWAAHWGGRPGAWINAYGPTEATVNATRLEWPSSRACEGASVPIGRPLAHASVHILNDGLQPVPVGVAGELHIGGMGLARGYLGRPDLTAEKFIADPFSQMPGGRLYKSGDMARFLPDGTIECLGRVDHQVKLRGFRVELGEIEAALASHPAVLEAVVMLREEGARQRLIAYFTHTGQVQTEALRAHVAALLPDYMRPSAYWPLQALPLSSNGKIDREALPVHDAAPPEGLSAAPRGRVEQALAGIWREALQLEHVGRRDDFFELGGHSLLAVRLLARVREALGCALPLSQLLRSPTIEQLAVAVAEGSSGQLVVPMAQAARRGAPIWLVHPAGGTVYCYRALAERLPSDRPIYAIQSPEAAGLGAAEPGFDALCLRYVSELVQVQPEGTVFLAGWSMGGALAFRMAELLEHQARRVGWVGIIDTLRAVRHEPMDFAAFAAWALMSVPTDAWVLDPELEGELAGWKAALRRHGEEGLRRCLATGLADGKGGGPPSRQRLLALFRERHEVHRAHAALMAGFVPGRIDAPVHVFDAQSSVLSGAAAFDWFAHTSCAHASTQAVLPGNHENVISLEGNLRAIAHALAAAGLVVSKPSGLTGGVP